jgi:hypothetical protein
LKPENLLYLTRAADSQLVLADFGHIDSLAVALLEHDLGGSISKGTGHAGQYLRGVVHAKT